ncbi:SGNH/GDSL hydrolase family protein [Paenibacillus antarcticus]|uniref:SGNH hydrolase-type esterase domain-containing protein n=1 Tax=Paenibacillus antarcticus TaxID=253703 RepID=A0A168PVK3_9BACL|nr:GDSL-type esterase/lipase family protein [Paenibacillus antarcticus]OAB47114.1 hypothetical protein PBAT_07475 [Paenibacillus antarcticus]
MTGIWNHRSSLTRTLQRIQEGELTIGFIGGSITDARPRHNWPEPVIAWFAERFPQVTLKIENAAIGATGSDLAVFRARRDLIERDCDLVFMEYAVNDAEEPEEKRGRTREGLIRQLVDGRGRDLLLTYTYCQEMYNDMMEGRVPDSISQLEKLAEHYRLGSVWMGKYALDEVQKGRIRWQDWLPDGLHPTQRGSLSYAHSVIAFLEQELLIQHGEDEVTDVTGKPDALYPMNWEKVELLPLEQVKCEGPWIIRRWVNLEWIDRVLETAAVGSKLSFTFVGRGLALGFDFGRASAEFRYRLCEGEWKVISRERPSWVADEGWFRMELIADDLDDGFHDFELEVIHGNRENCTGTDFRLAFIGVIR